MDTPTITEWESISFLCWMYSRNGLTQRKILGPSKAEVSQWRANAGQGRQIPVFSKKKAPDKQTFKIIPVLSNTSKNFWQEPEVQALAHFFVPAMFILLFHIQLFVFIHSITWFYLFNYRRFLPRFFSSISFLHTDFFLFKQSSLLSACCP